LQFLSAIFDNNYTQTSDVAMRAGLIKLGDDLAK